MTYHVCIKICWKLLVSNTCMKTFHVKGRLRYLKLRRYDKLALAEIAVVWFQDLNVAVDLTFVGKKQFQKQANSIFCFPEGKH